MFVLQVREDRDHGGRQRCRDTPRRAYPVTTVTGTTDEACPYCGATSGVQAQPAPPKVQAWSCSMCNTEWAISVVRPDSRAAALLTDLGATAEEVGRLRWTLRQVIALVDDAPTITDEQLRTRLVVLASGAR